MENNIIQAKPIIRWAGGKRWLVKQIDELFDLNTFNNYHEPFLGGGAIFFHILPKSTSFLNDINKELIETYHCVKEDVHSVIEELSFFKNTEEQYYKIRASRYRKPAKNAARFIFLNQTSFNGIYRVNLKGEYNVPYGHRKNVAIDPDVLIAVSDSLKNVKLSNIDFMDTADNINKGDLVFLDPPYTISHNKNGFFKYNAKLFTRDDQIRLSTMIDEIKSKDAYYIMTNAAHDEVKKIFEKNDNMIELKRASLIGGKNAKRDKYSELIVSNLKLKK